MRGHIFSILVLIMTVDSVCSTKDRFFMSGPSVFHVGVKERVFVQMGDSYLNSTVTLHLEHENTGTLLCKREIAQRANVQTVELKIGMENMLQLGPPKNQPSIALLVAESGAFSERKTTKVLISKHRGYIFIQTDQPMYTPTQKVRYRIFTLDHTFRSHMGAIYITVFNADGNNVMKSQKSGKGGLLTGIFTIPDISKTGTWRITAHYEGDEANAVSREFEVQQFVLPSFEVNIEMKEDYILPNTDKLAFTISAMYSYGKKVKGAYHCQFGVVEKSRPHVQKLKPVFIRGLELTGSAQTGTAEVSQSIAKISEQLQKEMNQTLFDLQQKGAQLYVRVFVTNIQSGEIQEAEVYVPVLSHKYTMDLSRTRSYFVFGFPFDVVVVMRLPDGSPAADVPVNIHVPGSREGSSQGITDQEGAVFYTFNIDASFSIKVNVTAEGLQLVKTIRRASSPGDSYLYISFTNRLYSVKESLTVTYNTVNGPSKGYIYYMVLSRGIIIQNGSHPLGSSVRDNLLIKADMVPSFRLVAYFYNQNGEIIADSVWVDVRDECEIKVKVGQKGSSEPGQDRPTLEFDIDDKTTKVALLAVDKAFYALKADNKLTDKQVFSAMQSYDLGCTYGGGPNPASVLRDAGLSFVSHSQSEWRKGFHCDSQFGRKRRSVDLHQEMMALKSNFSDEILQECCGHGLTLIPMPLTCKERAERVSLVQQNEACTDAFFQCCIAGERLRQRKIQEDAQKGFGRTVTADVIENFFLDSTAQYIRRYFPPSFAFKEYDVIPKLSVELPLPDSITTWEIQIVTLSPTTGLCVVKPSEIRAFKNTFVSLRLPYSVRKYEQISISPVIYNYGQTSLRLAVHMEQTEGLCSPGSATTSSYVNISVDPHSSQFVAFSAVPMVTGSMPIKIRVLKAETGDKIDAIEKTLNVWAEGLEQRHEKTHMVKLDGMSPKALKIDGTLPDEIIPDSTSNIFVSVEENGFGSQAVNLLSPERVAGLIQLPTGCCEQTMSGLAPTAAALRYFDLSEQWFNLPPGARDDALEKIEKGYIRVLIYKKSDGSYKPWNSVKSSTWLTAFVLKVFSLVAQHQPAQTSAEEIRHTASYLLSVQNIDGSFSDPHPVLHRYVLKGKDREASMTAFVTLALQKSLQFLQNETQDDVRARISNSTMYLMSNLEELRHPYAVAITAYCLSVCLPEGADLSAVRTRLQAMATERKDGCYLWTTDTSMKNQERADAITVETTAYALLTAVTLNHTQWADKAACWLISQENYFGTFRSTQDTVMALEALAEYDLKRSNSPTANLIAVFRVSGRNDIATLALANREKVEIDLKKFSGNNIDVNLSGEGEAKLKVVKAYHVLDPKDRCADLSLSVTVEGKVKYTDKVIETYDYYDDYDAYEEKEPKSANHAKPDTHERNRRDLDNNAVAGNTVTYTVCVSHSPDNNLTGMGIADITLLSGFEAVIEDLHRLTQEPEQYISHYEVSHGKVVIYFNEQFKPQECISFDATQKVPIGLLQPAPAVFYDYYEPDRKCTVFYSAPQRSKMVSRLCSEDVCQCAERPCHKLKITFKSGTNKALTKNDRIEHACFFPTVDYAYVVEVLSISHKTNFVLYKTAVRDILRYNSDVQVRENSVRVFAKRRNCKEELDLGKQYLIMGKDGTTTDSNGMMQYLLESNTWVEKRPSQEECRKSANQQACKGADAFINEYKVDGCRH